MIYLDANATARPLPEAIEATDHAMREAWANPSSVHRAGQEARRIVETARRDLAALIGCTPRELVFTGDGTEAIDMAIRGSIRRDNINIVTTSTEHAAVGESLEALSGHVQVRKAPVNIDGVVDADEVMSLVDDDTELVSVHWANNETGATQPIEQLALACAERRVRLHTDATQWVGKRPTDLSALPGVHVLTCSPHKFGGLKGVGVLVAKRGSGWASPRPGSQELGRRGGTENVPGIAAAGAAARAAIQWLAEPKNLSELKRRRDGFERAVTAACDGAVVVAAGADRLENTASIAFPSLEAEALLLLLSERGVCASAGAACSSGSLEPSPVLLAMGLDEKLAHGTVRFSLPRDASDEDMELAAKTTVEAVHRLSGSSASIA